MATLTFVAALAALSSIASAAQCQNLTIPVSISARNGVLNVPNPMNNIESIDFALDASRQGHNYTQEVLTGYATVSGEYEIAATYCHPDSGPSKVIQVLTHGIGFDRRCDNCAPSRVSTNKNLAIGICRSINIIIPMSARPSTSMDTARSHGTGWVSACPHTLQTRSMRDKFGSR